jgi:hypothetical protein
LERRLGDLSIWLSYLGGIRQFGHRVSKKTSHVIVWCCVKVL